ncbi:unnamed protein product, partial [Polarella glacialis]
MRRAIPDKVRERSRRRILEEIERSDGAERTAMKEESDVTLQSSQCEDFQSASERTRQALKELASRWGEEKCSLSEAGYKWSREVGFGYVLPTEAMTCRPISLSLPREDMSASYSSRTPVKQHQGLIVAPSPPCGFGLFATCKLSKGEVLGEYTGEIRNYRIWCDEIKARKVAARGSEASSPFIIEELYAAWAGSGPAMAG